jgi:hypothetical protein
MLIEKRANNRIKKIIATFILHILNYTISIMRIFYFNIYKNTSKITLLKKEKNNHNCLECGAKTHQYILPLDENENQFCERCKFGDYEGIS